MNNEGLGFRFFFPRNDDGLFIWDFWGDLCVCGVYMCACVCVGGVMNPCASTEVQREHHSQPYFLKMGSIIEPGARSGAGSQQSQ